MTKDSDLLGCYILLVGLKPPTSLRTAVPLFSEPSSLTHDDLSLLHELVPKKGLTFTLI